MRIGIRQAFRRVGFVAPLGLSHAALCAKMRVLAVRICCARRDRGYCNEARSSRACGDRAFCLFKRRQSVAIRRLHRFPQTHFCCNGMIGVGEMRPLRVLGIGLGCTGALVFIKPATFVTRCILPPPLIGVKTFYLKILCRQASETAGSHFGNAIQRREAIRWRFPLAIAFLTA